MRPDDRLGSGHRRQRRPDRSLRGEAGRAVLDGGKVTRLTAEDMPRYDQDFDYAGVDDHYFMTVALKTGID